MYSQDEINSAVASGVLSRTAAEQLRRHVVALRDRPLVDEEHFRLVSSFNDIFVTIGVLIMLFAAGAIGQAIAAGVYPRPAFQLLDSGSGIDFETFGAMSQLHTAASVAGAGLFALVTAWLLAEFFTRKRRMALPSIILLLAFIGGIFAMFGGLSGLIEARSAAPDDRLMAFLFAGSALIAAGGAYLHWRRFAVPITVAAGAAAIAGTIILLIAAAVGDNGPIEMGDLILALVFAAGIAIFMVAMRWDISDRTRTTRRADVAFWLHLLAAPMIAHPVFYALGVTRGDGIEMAGAIGVVAVYVMFGLVALAVDRRALLVSALAYVLFALTILFGRFGAVEMNVALTALVIGSALLTLSAFWSPIRRVIVKHLPPQLQDKLPVAGSMDAPADAVAANA